MKRLTLTVTAVLAIMLGTMFAYAAVQEGQGAAGTPGQYTTPSANAVLAEGGNVTEVNVSSSAGTTKWQGYWGNVSGSLVLGDGANTFYNWGALTIQAVFASPGNDITFGALNVVDTAGEKEAIDTLLTFGSAETDSVNQTMTGGACTAGSEIAAADGVTTLGAGAWATCIADDGGGLLDDVVFGTSVATGVSYEGLNIDYQIMVPVLAAGDNYYFYLEI